MSTRCDRDLERQYGGTNSIKSTEMPVGSIVESFADSMKDSDNSEVNENISTQKIRPKFFACGKILKFANNHPTMFFAAIVFTFVFLLICIFISIVSVVKISEDLESLKRKLAYSQAAFSNLQNQLSRLYNPDPFSFLFE